MVVRLGPRRKEITSYVLVGGFHGSDPLPNGYFASCKISAIVVRDSVIETAEH